MKVKWMYCKMIITKNNFYCNEVREHWIIDHLSLSQSNKRREKDENLKNKKE